MGGEIPTVTRQRDSAFRRGRICREEGVTSVPATAVDQEHSPSNGADRIDYLKKRREFFASGVHVVEIDLLRDGPRLPFSDAPDCDYLVAVSRAEERPRVGLWPIRLRDPLPEIPIPLRAPDPDAKLDLQKVLNTVYDSARYEPLLYQGTPQPPLPPEDAQWARQYLP